MIVDTESGEVFDRPPRTEWNTRQMRADHKQANVYRDIAIALGVYSFAATVVIAALV